jgi:hypothetical protein
MFGGRSREHRVQFVQQAGLTNSRFAYQVQNATGALKDSVDYLSDCANLTVAPDHRSLRAFHRLGSVANAGRSVNAPSDYRLVLALQGESQRLAP